MRDTRIAALLVLLTLSAMTRAQSIELSGPTQPIAPNRPIQITVSGVTAAQSTEANLEWSPKDGAEAWMGNKWPDGPVFVNFAPSRAGTYTVEVSVGNAGLARWRDQVITSLAELDRAVAKGTEAGASPDIITSLQAAKKTLEDQAAAIPGQYGECIIQVGESPPPPDPPGPTANPYPAPSAEARAAVGPITQVSLPPSTAQSVSQIFATAANTVKTNLARIAAGVTPEVGTTAQAQALLKTEIVKLSIAGKYAGLAEGVDSALDALIGQASRPIRAEDETALLAIAWAMFEAGRNP